MAIDKPERYFSGRNPPRVDATWLDLLWAGIKESAGQILNWWGVAGFVQPMEIQDTFTNTHVKVRVSGFFTVISIDGRDFYFKRLTGGYDGSGMSVNRRRD